MSWIKHGCVPWLLLAAEMAVVRPALAQIGAGVLTGKVTDAASKEVVTDVVVTVTSPALQGEEVVVTDGSGTYRIPNLPPGEYTVRFEKESYKPFSRGSVTLRADSTIRLDASLLPESLKAEEVVVVAQAPTVDIGSTSTGTTITSEVIRRIPIVAPSSKGAGSKSFEALAVSAPGARSDEFGVSISGTTSPENQYLIDGISVNSTSTGTVSTPLSSEFVKEVNVITGGYMPEYGRATGGVLNVITKSGSNEFHGGVWGELTPGALAATAKNVVRATDIIQASERISSIWNLGFDLGGPIQKDKIWFYAGFQVAQTTYELERSLNPFIVDPDTKEPVLDPLTGLPTFERMPGSEQIFHARSTGYQGFGKLTYSINPDNRLILSAYATPSRSGGSGDYSISFERGKSEVNLADRGMDMRGSYEGLARYRRADAYGASLGWTSEFNKKKILLDTTLGWNHLSFAILPSDGSLPGSNQGLFAISAVRWRSVDPVHPITDFEAVSRPEMCTEGRCPASWYNAASGGYLEDQNQDRYQFKSVLTYFGEGLGHHVVKAGVDGEYAIFENHRGFPGSAVLEEDPTVVGTEASPRIRITRFGWLTSPDTAKVLNDIRFKSKSVVVGGFVQDSWSVLDKVTLNLGARYDTQFIFGGRGDHILTLPNQWSPRIGAIWDPTQSGRAKIFANYARFYENVPLGLSDRAGTGEPTVITRIAARDCNPRTPEAAKACLAATPVTRVISSRPDRLLSIQGAGSTPIDPDISAQSSDEIVLGADYDLIARVRAGLSYTRRWMHRVIEDMSSDEGQTYFIGNPGRGIASGFPEAERNYDAITAQLTRAFSDRWLASASYTLSWLRGNYSGLFRPETAQLDPNTNSDFDLKALLVNRIGPLPGDRRHQIRVQGAYEIPLPNAMHLTAGGAVTAHSGDATNFTGAHSSYGDGEVFLLPRGSGDRLPWVFSGDARLAYGIQVWGNKVIELSVDVFNLFNFQEVIDRDDRFTTAFVLPVPNGTRNDLPNGQGNPGRVLHEEGGALLDYSKEYNKNFGQPVRYQEPRYFKFGVRATF